MTELPIQPNNNKRSWALNLGRTWEGLCLAVFLALAGWQLFVCPITGLSDNNDFPKVLGPAHVCKAPFSNVNTYFVTGYAAGPKCLWPSGFTSTEILFVDVARYLGRPFTGRYYFDIRASAAVHLLVLGVAMGLFLALTRRRRPLVRYLLPPLAILMFTDVAYVAYLNSAYMDNASWVLFLLLISIAALACVGKQDWIAPAYALTALLLVFSKAQHAVLALPFAALAAWFAWRDPDSLRRSVWSLGALALLVSMAIMPGMTPPEYSNISLYNLIFYRLAPTDPAILDQLGLDTSYRKWIGTTAFVPGSPLPDPDWTRAFLSHVSFGDILRLYLQHPSIALRQLDSELHDSVHAIRPVYMANYRESDGFPPHSVATRFSFWSDLRMDLLTRYPYFLLFLFGLPLVAALFRPRATFLPLALALVAAGVCEFAVCTLADGVDTHRHLFLFQVITETLTLLIVSAGLSYHNVWDAKISA